MNLFFEPLKFSVTDANNPVEFIDVPFGILGSGGFSTLVTESSRCTFADSITPQFYLGWIHLVLCGYLVNGFVAFERSQGNGCLLFGSKLSSH
jgi:hypothetical protein